ncbi:MAG TPA: T9SS type A sorting domain-containing protein, partial [Flavobacteriales bacterium]|nr:T9SS type A sorting domain-containing protein [Flavobacteriales bacterium]
MKHVSAALLAFGFLQPWIGLGAQPLVDIGLHDNGAGMLEVRLRPDGPFDGLTSSIVFTIRWSDASGATMGLVSQPSPISTYLPVGKSGPMQFDGGYRYQIFSGISLVTLLDAETAWVGGEEVVLCQVPIVGASYFEIVNDPWTANVDHNGDYYISLNGLPRTGEIYSINTGMVQGAGSVPTISVQPNPTDGQARLTVSVQDRESLAIEIFDPTGRSIMKGLRPDVVGIYRETLDMGIFADGVYLLKLSVGEQV